MAKPVLGLIGGIASGKSTAAAMLRKLGVEVIDADRLAHEELDREDVVSALARWWPDAVVGDRVDRKTLAINDCSAGSKACCGRRFIGFAT